MFSEIGTRDVDTVIAKILRRVECVMFEWVKSLQELRCGDHCTGSEKASLWAPVSRGPVKLMQRPVSPG